MRRVLFTSISASSRTSFCARIIATPTQRLLCTTADGSEESKPCPIHASGVKSKNDGPFYSKYYKLGQSEVENYLKRHEMAYRKSGRHLIIKECPFCHPIKGSPSNMYKLYVLASTGVYMCHRCQASGSWFQFRKEVGGAFDDCYPLLESGEVSPIASADESGAELESKKLYPSRLTLKKYSDNLYEKHSDILKFVEEQRGLRPDVLAKYAVGLAHNTFRDEETGKFTQELCYMFPMFSSRRKLVRYKVRATYKKRFMKLEPKGGEWGLFGFDTLQPGTKEVVLTEGEFDAMAVHQATGRPALSLPNGASSLPVSIVHALERFKTIYLWMDDDIPGQDGARQFAKKLGRNRCRVVQTKGEAKDANDALLKGLNIEAMIAESGPVPHEGVTTFKDLKNEVYHEIMHSNQLKGRQSLLLPQLTNVLSGHRRGELTIYSGHTGTGKTTLLSQLSLDYCIQGVPTLWGSFEIRTVRLARLLLEQLYSSQTGAPVSSLKDNFVEWAERFEELPMYFMRYYGTSPIDRVIDAMEYGNYVHDISHVLLDNLQFMTSGQGRNSFERFDVMDSAIQKLRQYSTENNVHVSLVVHPRKENDESAIQTASVFGSAKATQEADNVVILQRTANGGRALEVRKNRFDGQLGKIELKFDKNTKLFKYKNENSDEPVRITPQDPTLSVMANNFYGVDVNMKPGVGLSEIRAHDSSRVERKQGTVSQHVDNRNVSPIRGQSSMYPWMVEQFMNEQRIR